VKYLTKLETTEQTSSTDYVVTRMNKNLVGTNFNLHRIFNTWNI